MLGYNDLPMPETADKTGPMVYEVPLTQTIKVRKGDFIGHYCKGVSGIPFSYDSQHGPCHWKFPIQMSKKGEILAMSAGDARNYAYGFSLGAS